MSVIFTEDEIITREADLTLCEIDPQGRALSPEACELLLENRDLALRLRALIKKNSLSRGTLWCAMDAGSKRRVLFLSEDLKAGEDPGLMLSFCFACLKGYLEKKAVKSAALPLPGRAFAAGELCAGLIYEALSPLPTVCAVCAPRYPKPSRNLILFSQWLMSSRAEDLALRFSLRASDIGRLQSLLRFQKKPRYISELFSRAGFTEFAAASLFSLWQGMTRARVRCPV